MRAIGPIEPARQPPGVYAMLRMLAIALSCAASCPAANAADEPAGYRVLDDRLAVRRLATIPGESLAQIVVGPEGHLFLGGREAVFVVEPGEVGPGLVPEELYREPGDRWFMGLAVRGEDLIVAKHDAVLVLPGAAWQRGPATARRIVWGFPAAKGWAFHQTLHDLKVGPDGRLTFTMGDPAWSFGDARRPDHWFRTRIETAGVPADRPIVGVGGLFRCDPDGSNLTLLSTGTRNSNGFDWNERFDLFTTDNDHEQDPRYVPSRLLLHVDGGFYNWPRGWMDGRPEDLPALAGMGREVPVGLAVYGDSRLPAEYRGNVLIARWGRQSIDRFAPEPAGSGYTAREIPWLVCPPGRRPMAVAVGRGGRVYAIVGHMESNAESPVYTADLLEIDLDDDAPAYDPPGLDAMTLDEVFAELEAPDLSTRMAAHVWLTAQGGPALRGLGRRLDALLARDDEGAARALPHLIRLAGLSTSEESFDRLVGLLDDDREALREQAVRALAQRGGVPDDRLATVLADPSPRVRRAGLEAMIDRPKAAYGNVLVEVARLAASHDPYLRQLAARQLARSRLAYGSALAPGPMGDPGGQSPPILGLGSVLADGFLTTIPPADAPLPPGLALADSAYEEPPTEGGRRLGMFTIDAWWKALDKTPAHEHAFQRLLRGVGDPDPVVALQALRSVDRLGDPRAIPILEKRIDASAGADADEAVIGLAVTALARLAGPAALDRVVKVLASGPEGARRAAAEAVVAMELPADSADRTLAAAGRPTLTALLKQLAIDPATPATLRGSALDRLGESLEPGALGEVLAAIDPASGWRVIAPTTRLAATKLATDDAARLLGAWLESPSEDARRAAAQAIGASRRPELVALVRGRLAAEASPMVVRPLAEALIGSDPHAEADDRALAALLARRGDLDPGLSERVSTFLKGRPGFADLANAATAAPTRAGPFAGIDWEATWRSGDLERGRALFEAKSGVSCIACHRFGGQGGNNGPSLEDADQRLTVAYLVESILAPNAHVAPQYQPTTVALKSGEVVVGIVLQEGPTRLTLGLADGTTRELATDQVEERMRAEASIMPEGLAKTPDDLRDLLAYLLTPRPR